MKKVSGFICCISVLPGRKSACVAPIPLGWYQLMQQTGLRLHEPDGNHANKTGAAFTAFMLYQVLSGDPADQLPTIPALNISAACNNSYGNGRLLLYSSIWFVLLPVKPAALYCGQSARAGGTDGRSSEPTEQYRGRLPCQT